MPFLKIIADVAHGIIYFIVSKQGRTKTKDSNGTIQHYMCCGLVPFQIIFFFPKKVSNGYTSRQRDV